MLFYKKQDAAQRGKFITFEGGEGAGKSTQIKLLMARLQAAGLECICTREPGGSPGAEVIREVLLSGAVHAHGPEVEAMLFAAARADHIDSVIRPALAAGTWVLCDRFADSSRVYQGEAGVDKQTIENLQRIAVDGVEPDLTLLIDVPAELGLKRVNKRSQDGPDNAPDRFEKDSLETHQRRRQLFLQIARENRERFAVIDGSRHANEVEEQIKKVVSMRFEAELPSSLEYERASLPNAAAKRGGNTPKNNNRGKRRRGRKR